MIVTTLVTIALSVLPMSGQPSLSVYQVQGGNRAHSVLQNTLRVRQLQPTYGNIQAPYESAEILEPASYEPSLRLSW